MAWDGQPLVPDHGSHQNGRDARRGREFRHAEAMTPEEFVDSIKLTCFDSAADLIPLLNPPGQQPHDSLLKIARWLSHLHDRDREYVDWIAREAAYAAIFNIFCVLDGVQVFDDDHGNFA
jgi:hypothetical protein